VNSDSDDTRNNLQLRIALAIVGVIFLGLIVLVFFTNLQGSDSDDLELICNGDDCTWFPAKTVNDGSISANCAWVGQATLSRPSHWQCGPFRR